MSEEITDAPRLPPVYPKEAKLLVQRLIQAPARAGRPLQQSVGPTWEKAFSQRHNGRNLRMILVSCFFEAQATGLVAALPSGFTPYNSGFVQAHTVTLTAPASPDLSCLSAWRYFAFWYLRMKEELKREKPPISKVQPFPSGIQYFQLDYGRYSFDGHEYD